MKKLVWENQLTESEFDGIDEKIKLNIKDQIDCEYKLLDSGLITINEFVDHIAELKDILRVLTELNVYMIQNETE